MVDCVDGQLGQEAGTGQYSTISPGHLVQPETGGGGSRPLPDLLCSSQPLSVLYPTLMGSEAMWDPSQSQQDPDWELMGLDNSELSGDLASITDLTPLSPPPPAGAYNVQPYEEQPYSVQPYNVQQLRYVFEGGRDIDDTVVTDSHRRRNNVGAGERRRLPGGGGTYGVTHGNNSAIDLEVLSSHLDRIREWFALLSYPLLPFLVILFYSRTSEFPSFGQVAEFSEESLCLSVTWLMGRRLLGGGGGGGQPERGGAVANNWAPSIRAGIFFAAMLAIFSFVYFYMMRVGDAESESVPDPG
jgi:hypothetical protein